eukprot:scaffold2045_cov203-Alexandrium_tamarense.AAC.38
MIEGVRKCRLASPSHQHRTTKCKGTWTTCYLARLYQLYTDLNNRRSRDRVSDFKRLLHFDNTLSVTATTTTNFPTIRTLRQIFSKAIDNSGQR